MMMQQAAAATTGIWRTISGEFGGRLCEVRRSKTPRSERRRFVREIGFWWDGVRAPPNQYEGRRMQDEMRPQTAVVARQVRWKRR